MIYLGADHGGYALKEFLKEKLILAGFDVEDCGANQLDSTDDYPQYAHAVAQKVSQNEGAFGILCCRSGAGMVIAANRVPKVRAVEGWNKEFAQRTRQHNNANVLALAGDWLSHEDAWIIVQAFLNEPFSSEERHLRRVAQLG